MYKKNGYGWLKHGDFMLLDLLCMELAFWLSVFLRNGFSYDPALLRVYVQASAVLVLVNIVVVFFFQSYKNVLRKRGWEAFWPAFLHVTGIVVLMLLYLYMVQEAVLYSRLVYVLFWALYLCFTTACRTLLRIFLLSRRKLDEGRRSLLIIACQSNAQSVVRTVYEHAIGDIKIVGAALCDRQNKSEIPREIGDIPVVAYGEGILPYIKESWVDEVLFCLPQGEEAPRELINGCREMGITLHIQVADAAEDFGMRQSVEKFGGYTVLTESLRMASPAQIFCKRLMDIIGSLIGLLFTGIAFLFVAPAIEIQSPGPVFFAQTRVGKNGKQFKIYKFRSMYRDADAHKQELMDQNEVEGGLMFKVKDDPRVIKGIGSFIRKTSIDELPQFWNVLKGDMSLVGTRPPTVDEWKKYKPHHRRRLAVRPGITGLWQVSGRSNITDFEEVVRLDTQYIQEWSLWLDMKILLKTIGVVMKGEGSS